MSFDLLSASTSFPANIAHEIESIIDAKGSVSNGVFSIGIDRDDIEHVTLKGVHILPSFEINGDLVFQSLGGRQVAMNSDMCLKSDEIDPFIDQLLAHNIVFQAEHQHFYDFEPIVWFIHFRAVGDAATIAKGCKAALNVTSTPFPQAPPAKPSTPLPAHEIGRILGAAPSVGSNGVVTYQIPRAESIVLGGVRINPYLNVSAPVSFQPLDGGKSCAAVPDFNFVASEVMKVMRLMRGRGWDIGCLYNQETDEQPQLFFSHQFKTGEPLQLAREIRAGFDLMNVKFVSQ